LAVNRFAEIAQKVEVFVFPKNLDALALPAWSPLGNQIAFEYAETTGNIWIADLKSEDDSQRHYTAYRRICRFAITPPNKRSEVVVSS